MKSVKILILLIAALSVASMLLTGCNAKPSDAATEGKPGTSSPSDNTETFKDLITAVEDNEFESIGIVRIDDPINADSNLERQVYQVILEELTKVAELNVVEKDSIELQTFLETKNIDPKRGLGTESAVSLADFFDADAIIYGTMESTSDLNIKMYSQDEGGIVFSKTIRGIILPSSRETSKFEVPDTLLDDVPLSDETIKEFNLDKKSGE